MNGQSQLQGGNAIIRQLYRPKPIIIGVAGGGGEGALVPVTIRVPVPSSQTRIKLSVMFVPSAGAAIPNMAGFFSIWVAACDQDRGGSAAGRLIPVNDVEGSRDLPTPFPTNNGGAGYSRSFVTSADWLQAVVQLAGPGGVTGSWVVQTSVQAEAVFLPWAIWQQICDEFNPDATPLGVSF